MKKHQNLCTKTKKVIDRGKISKSLNEVKAVENKNPQDFLGTHPKQTGVLPSDKLNCKTKYTSFRITEKLPESVESSKFVHTQQECQESLIQEDLKIGKENRVIFI